MIRLDADMTIRIDHLVYAEGNDVSELGFDRDAKTVPLSDEDTLALVRHIFRDRSDMDMMPRIIGVIGTGSPNEFGHNSFIHVQYAQRGYQATYGATIHPKGVTSFGCYLD